MIRVHTAPHTTPHATPSWLSGPQHTTACRPAEQPAQIQHSINNTTPKQSLAGPLGSSGVYCASPSCCHTRKQTACWAQTQSAGHTTGCLPPPPPLLQRCNTQPWLLLQPTPPAHRPRCHQTKPHPRPAAPLAAHRTADAAQLAAAAPQQSTGTAAHSSQDAVAHHSPSPSSLSLSRQLLFAAHEHHHTPPPHTTTQRHPHTQKSGGHADRTGRGKASTALGPLLQLPRVNRALVPQFTCGSRPPPCRA